MYERDDIYEEPQPDTSDLDFWDFMWAIRWGLYIVGLTMGVLLFFKGGALPWDTAGDVAKAATRMAEAGVALLFAIAVKPSTDRPV